VTDSSADLPDAILDRHRIALVPLQVVFGNSTFRDRVELNPEDFYRRFRGSTELPTTSQPAPADCIQAFRDARGEADEVVAVLLGSALSGTFNAAQTAIRAAGLERIHLGTADRRPSGSDSWPYAAPSWPSLGGPAS
jgi:DegV family protein with EDD domain